jgi:nitroimidazol reductase NimA-like FMN-containing flavoprotein (pyridoxamine 5'-phosphate oxidase superfamily)
MDERAAAGLIRRCHYCLLGTASADGAAWVSPVFFNYDSDLHLYFESALDSRHSRLIVANPRVSIVVTDFVVAPIPEAVYFEAEALEVAGDRIEHALEVFQHGPHERTRDRRTPADYSSGKPLRLYEAVPRLVYGLVEVQVDDYDVEQRATLDLNGVIAHLRQS